MLNLEVATKAAMPQLLVVHLYLKLEIIGRNLGSLMTTRII